MATPTGALNGFGSPVIFHMNSTGRTVGWLVSVVVNTMVGAIVVMVATDFVDVAEDG
jgi:hypothetical protein